MSLISLALLAAAGDAGRICPAGRGELPSAPIEIVNRGRQSIYNLYAAPVRARRWGCDRLDDFTIPPGRSRMVTPAHRPGQCVYRLKLVLADRSQRVRKVDLCRGGRWTIGEGAEAFEPAPRP